MSTQIHAPLTVISPHLDDAVFSCGDLIAAALDPVVVTVFAGVPEAGMAAPPWDRAAGFERAPQAVLHRRHEDARALARLGARPEWLDLLDGQYGRRYTPEQLMVSLASASALHRGGTIVAPMGLFHSDHILVGRACLLMQATTMAGHPVTVDAVEPAAPIHWLFYEDAIYRRLPGVLQTRLFDWWQEGMRASPVHLPSTSAQAKKMHAVAAYESQLPLFDAHQLTDIGAPERYWSIDMDRRAPHR
nr:PIG-L family deacetylase [uncultured Cupriavidus sp.]